MPHHPTKPTLIRPSVCTGAPTDGGETLSGPICFPAGKKEVPMSILDAYDPAREAVLEPSHAAAPVEGFPETVVVTLMS